MGNLREHPSQRGVFLDTIVFQSCWRSMISLETQMIWGGSVQKMFLEPRGLFWTSSVICWIHYRPKSHNKIVPIINHIKVEIINKHIVIHAVVIIEVLVVVVLATLILTVGIDYGKVYKFFNLIIFSSSKESK